MQSLLRYLADLAGDPTAQQAFARDPEAAIAAAPLSEADRHVLRTRNSSLIHAALGAQVSAALIYGPSTPSYPAGPPVIVYASTPPAAVPQAPAPHIVHGAGQPAASPPFIIYVGGPQSPPAPPAPPPQTVPCIVYASGHAVPVGAPPIVYGTGQPPIVYGTGQPPIVYGTGQSTSSGGTVIIYIVPTTGLK